MDELDLRLCQVLFADPRMLYRELTDKLGISVSAVHGRIKALTDERRVALVSRKEDGKVVFTLEVQLRLVSAEQGRELSGLPTAASETYELLSRGFSPVGRRSRGCAARSAWKRTTWKLSFRA